MVKRFGIELRICCFDLVLAFLNAFMDDVDDTPDIRCISRVWMLSVTRTISGFFREWMRDEIHDR